MIDNLEFEVKVESSQIVTLSDRVVVEGGTRWRRKLTSDRILIPQTLGIRS